MLLLFYISMFSYLTLISTVPKALMTYYDLCVMIPVINGCYVLLQVNHLDFKLYGKYPEAAKSINSYWENMYDDADSVHRDDIHTTHFHAFARISLSKVNPSSETNEDCVITPTKLKSVRLHRTAVLNIFGTTPREVVFDS